MTTKERFDAKWTPEPYSGCWLWTGSTKTGTYGAFSVKNFPRFAHRVSWELHRGDIPEGMFVCHSCDTPACVNPDHLFLGTHRDNMKDMRRKSRFPHGEQHPNSKLTEDQVIAIRDDNRSHVTIAGDYGVHQVHISRIKRGVRWERV